MRSKNFSIASVIRRVSQALWRDQTGVAAIVFTITLPALVAFAALAIDMSYAYWTRTQLQHAASVAALAGASQLNAPADTAITVKAEDIADANLNMDRELESLGLRDWLAQRHTWLFVEWPERAPALAARCDVTIGFELAGAERRTVSLQPQAEAGERALKALAKDPETHSS